MYEHSLPESKEETINKNELPSSAGDASEDRNVSDRELALRIADIISDTPASNTLVLDIRGLSPFADFFVICAGENERQLRAILRILTETLTAEGIRPERTEGTPAAGWILVDYGATIVHIFAADQRGFYRLEELWSEAPTLLAIQ